MSTRQPVAAYLVRGDDPSLVSEAVRELVHDMVGSDVGLAVEDLSGEDVDIGTVIDACVTPPFLAGQRVVVVRDVGRFRAEDAARLVAYLQDPVPTTVLVLGAGGGQVAPRLAAAVKAVGHVMDASRPRDDRSRGRWLAARLKRAPVLVDARAAAQLSEHLGEDVARLAGLLDALAAAYGEGAAVGVEQIAPFLGDAGGVAPWELTDAIDGGDIEAALAALHRLMGAGQRHALVVMATLHRHFANMLRLDGSDVGTEAEAAELLGMKSTFPAAKALRQARALGSAKVAHAISLLAAADFGLRGVSGWPDELVLEVLVARLCRLSPRRPARHR